MTPLRKAMSELDNSLPDYLFDEGKAHDEGLLELINNLWDEIDKAEKLMAKGEIADKYIKKWKK